MTSPERIKELHTLHKEFYSTATDERKTEIVKQVVVWAKEEMPESYCRECRNSGVHIPDTRPRCPGHVYTDDGLIEYQSISRICEWCFDKLMMEPDDPRRIEWFGKDD